MKNSNNTDMDKIKELLSKITSERKWYAIHPDEREQVRLRVTACRIRKGEASADSIKRFFSVFGYQLKINVSLEKDII